MTCSEYTGYNSGQNEWKTFLGIYEVQTREPSPGRNFFGENIAQGFSFADWDGYRQANILWPLPVSSICSKRADNYSKSKKLQIRYWEMLYCSSGQLNYKPHYLQASNQPAELIRFAPVRNLFFCDCYTSYWNGLVGDQVCDLRGVKSMSAIGALNFKPSHFYEPDMGFNIFQSPLQKHISQYKLIS
jgi:hypothetical protein